MSAPVFQDKVTVIAENFLNAISKTVYEGLGGKATPDEIVAWLGLTPGSGGTTTVIDDLLSHAIADALSANQGRILDGKIVASEQTANKGVSSGYAPLDAGAKVPVANLPDALDTSTFATHQEVIAGDALQQTLDEKDQASGYVSLDANSKVPLQFLPASSTSNHLYATVAEMLADGPHVNSGDTALVHGDPDPINDGHYVALKDHPAVIADWFKDDAITPHRHNGDDVDVTVAGNTETLTQALNALAASSGAALQADGSTPLVSILPAAVSALAVNSLYLDERAILMWKDSTGLHEVLNLTAVAANTAAIAANAGKIATNTTGVATATSDAAAAKSDAATALSAANTASSGLSDHINKVADAHPYTAITDVERVFTDRLGGYRTDGTMEPIGGDLNLITKSGGYSCAAQNVTNGPAGLIPSQCLLVVFAEEIGVDCVQEFYQLNVSNNAPETRKWRRTLRLGVWSGWVESYGAVKLTKAAHDALVAAGTTDANTLYLIVG